jgi:hypothetical protein
VGEECARAVGGGRGGWERGVVVSLDGLEGASEVGC